MLATTEAIVLHTRKFGDTSKIVTLYTREFGRCTVVAKGARKPKSKFGSSLEPLSYSSITLYKRPNRELHLLSKSETITPFRKIFESFENLTTGLSVVEAISATQEVDEPNEELFELLRATLTALNSAQDNVFAIFAAFQVSLARIMGFAFDFEQCHETRTKIVAEETPEFILSLSDGAIFAPGIANMRTGFRLDAPVVASLQRLSGLSPIEASKISFDERQKEQLQNLFVQYFSFHLEKRFSYRSHGLRKIAST